MKNNTNGKLVSVIVPVYNVEKYLKTCLDSIINQTHKNLQIILVDDGSTDSSKRICDEYALKDGRIVVIHKENKGISIARNTALKIATGEYVLFVDSDDFIDLNVIEQCLIEDRDLVMFPYKREYIDDSVVTTLFKKDKVCFGKDNEEDIETLRKRFVGLLGKQLSKPQRIESLSTIWGKLYKKSVIDKVLFESEKLVRSEDLLFNIRCIFNIKTASYISNVYYHYNKINVNSFTKTFDQNIIVQWKCLYNKIKTFLYKHNVTKDYYTALSNRRALSTISLILHISNQKNVKLSKKLEQIKEINIDYDYKHSIKNLPLKHLPFCFKIFFICAKMRCRLGLIVLGKLMNKLRKRA